MTVVRSKSHGVQMHGDHMFWGTKIEGPPDSKVCMQSRSNLIIELLRVVRLRDIRYSKVGESFAQGF